MCVLNTDEHVDSLHLVAPQYLTYSDSVLAMAVFCGKVQ